MIRLLCLLACWGWLVSPLSAAQLPDHVSLKVTGEPLLVALDRLAHLAHAGLCIHHNAQQIVREEADIQLVDEPWEAVAKALWLHQVEARLEDDVLVVRSWNARSRLRLRREIHSTAAIAVAVQPHPGPRLGVQSAPEAMPETGLILGNEGNPDTTNELIEGLQAGIEPESWANEGVSIEDYNGAVVLVQSPEVQLMAKAYFARMEADHARQLLVRGYRLPTPPAGKRLLLDAAAWATLAKNLAPEIAFTVVDGQRNHHFSGVRRSYVAADLYENNLGSPILGMLTTGLMLDVQADVTVMGISTRIRLQSTTWDKMTTSPVKDAAGHLLFDIDLPDLRADEADDMRLIPPGGAALYRFDDRTYAVSVDLLDQP